MVRRYGNHVKQLVMTEELFLTRPTKRISPSVVVKAFSLTSECLTKRKCYFGQDTTILHAILELEYLKVLRVLLCAWQSVFYDDFTFHFTHAAMNTLASIAVNMSL